MSTPRESTSKPPAWAESLKEELIVHIDRRFGEIKHRLTTIRQKENILMADVTVDSAALDQLSTDLTDIADNLSAEIQALNVPKGDLGPVQAQIDRLKGLETPAPTPAPTPDPSAGGS